MASKRRWVVLKFGGTSVATPERWKVITDEVKRVRENGERACVVVSALSQVTNRLNKCIEESLKGIASTEENSSYQWIKSAHMKLAEALGIKPKEKSMMPVMDLLEELQRLLDGIILTQEASPRLCARICAFGELMSSQLGLFAIQAAGHPCVRLDARRLIKSVETATQQESDRYLNANVNPVTDLEAVEEELKLQANPEDCAVITQGFIGSTPKGFDCLLGRGGSDTSGALFAALLKAVKLEIWTDVHGLFTSDPRHVYHTRLIHTTNYRVAQELASMGAKVLHPRCLVPASWANIPVEVHNTQDPKGPYTRIESSSSTKGVADTEKVTRILAVTQRSGQVLINITNLSMWGEAGFLSRVFLPFGELDVSVDLVATSQYAVSLTLDHIPGGVGGDVYTRLLERLGSLGTVSTKTECAVVSVVGEHLRTALPELGKALSESLDDSPECTVHLMTQSSEDLNLSWVVDESQARQLVQGLHNRLFPPEDAKDRWEDLRPPASGELQKSWSGASLTDGPVHRDSKMEFSPTERSKGEQA
jgi:diaminopimelate decarboxylase/aspartate kinase